ncbi:MAG TPA: sigma-70 family RNA polymerase sigma factor [Terriglobia bacterium]|nr:sigma-70 family RNA polymerase sigma factor [Terriglobia bacterium]
MALAKTCEIEWKTTRLKNLTDVAGIDFGGSINESRSAAAPPVIEISEDVRLVNAARDGNRTAFGELYARYARVVHGILLARVPPDEVDDIVHDVFLHAMRKLGSLRDGAAFAGWLAAIARHRAADFHRRSREHVELPEDLAETRATHPEPHSILAMIRALPDAYSETLILRLVEGLTGPEIAARTGLTPGSVRVNLHRGLEQLRARLGQSEKS